MGEIVGGRWKQYALKPLVPSGDGLLLQIDAELSLSMLLLCEEADREPTVAQMEVWMQTPWKLEGDR